MSIKSLLKELDNCKDSTSSEARAIRRKLRAGGHFVSGKQAKKKSGSKKPAPKEDPKKGKSKGEDGD